MNFIWALLYNCKSSLFYWIFHWTFIIGGRKVLLKQTSQNMKVMNSSCFVTEQTKVHMEGDLGTTRAQLWHHGSLPQPPLALFSLWDLWELPAASTLLGVHILAPAQCENTHCLWEQHPWKEVTIKFSASKILPNVLWSYFCKVPSGMLLLQPWCPDAALLLFQGVQCIADPSQSHCWFLSVLLDELCGKLKGDVTCGAFCVRNELLSLGSEILGLQQCSWGNLFVLFLTSVSALSPELVRQFQSNSCLSCWECQVLGFWEAELIMGTGLVGKWIWRTLALNLNKFYLCSFVAFLWCMYDINFQNLFLCYCQQPTSWVSKNYGCHNSIA